jgi:release factor glutamine methyltransferase
MNIRSLLQYGRQQLQQSSTKQPAADSESLLCWILSCDRSYLIAHAAQELGPDQEHKFLKALEKRCNGTPMQYIRGRQEFWGYDFLVTPDVLIPRPETELLIENALRLVVRDRHTAAGSAILIADIATGSGCLAVTLALEIPGSRIAATDISEKALAVARGNAERLGVLERVDLMGGDLGEPVRHGYGTGAFDLVVCNPPYGAWLRQELFEKEVLGFEPHLALFGGQQGTEIIQRLIPQVWELLKTEGYLLLEIGIDQAEGVAELFREGWSRLEFHADLQGIPRCLIAQKKG